MNKIIIFLFLLPFFSSGQTQKQTKNYISIGFLDHKTGNSAIGYTRSILQNENNELFIGCGSMIAVHSFIIGYKKYLLRTFVDGYAVISMQKIYGMGGDLNAPGLSIGFEKRVWRFLFLNIGVNSTIRFSSSEKTSFMTFPNVNINIRY